MNIEDFDYNTYGKIFENKKTGLTRKTLNDLLNRENEDFSLDLIVDNNHMNEMKKRSIYNEIMLIAGRFNEFFRRTGKQTMSYFFGSAASVDLMIDALKKYIQTNGNDCPIKVIVLVHDNDIESNIPKKVCLAMQVFEESGVNVLDILPCFSPSKEFENIRDLGFNVIDLKRYEYRIHDSVAEFIKNNLTVEDFINETDWYATQGSGLFASAAQKGIMDAYEEASKTEEDLVKPNFYVINLLPPDGELFPDFNYVTAVRERGKRGKKQREPHEKIAYNTVKSRASKCKRKSYIIYPGSLNETKRRMLPSSGNIRSQNRGKHRPPNPMEDETVRRDTRNTYKKM